MSSGTMTDALKQFEAVEANIVKLDRLWKQIDQMLPSDARSLSLADPISYRQLARAFRHIQQAMPKIDGFELKYEILDPDDVIGIGVDVLELDDITANSDFSKSIRAQGDILAEYGFRVSAKRRELARQALDTVRASVEGTLQRLSQATDGAKPAMKIPPEAWADLKNDVKAIDALLGNAISRPTGWQDLQRHLHFGQKADLDDICKWDWPSVKAGLDKVLFGEEDPLPVSVADLGVLVSSKPAGPVTTELQWPRVSPGDFERLLFNIVDRTPGYENPAWLTHTNAPDRGRDLSVERIQGDLLTGSRRMRLVIACKHTSSVGLQVVSVLASQMGLWEPPRVDELIIATSGHFTTDAVQWIEKHNLSDKALRIGMWPASHLERLLAQRPELIAEFKLR